LVDYLTDQKGTAKVRNNKIVITRDWASENDKIRGAFQIAKDLAEKVADEKKPKIKAE
jgi:transcription-repair coupling factor (superfamily II helicase)